MGIRNLVCGLLLGAIAVLSLHLFSGDRSDPNPQASPAVARQASGSVTHVVSRRAASATPYATEVDQASVRREEQAGLMETQSLKQLLRESTESAEYRPATKMQLTEFERLVARTLVVGEIEGELHQHWGHAGWKIYRCEHDVLVISEQAGKRRGRGIYAIRHASKSNLVLQAPHRFYDEGSGLIARKIFQENSLRAVAWNTVHRRKVDLAHCDDHYINAFTRAVVTVDQGAKILQLHGFNSEKYSPILNPQASSAKVILSDGTKFPNRQIVSVAANLKTAFGAGSILLFPSEVDVLGGTQNQQSKLMRRLGSSRFLHIEMEKKFRESMINDTSVRQKFIDGFRT